MFNNHSEVARGAGEDGKNKNKKKSAFLEIG